MNLNYKYWYFSKVIPERICDQIIATGTQSNIVAGITGFENTDINSSKYKEIRDSDIAWLNLNWIYKELYPIIEHANKAAGWNFDWDDSEHCQYTQYGSNQYYGWHQDSWDRPYKNENHSHMNGKVRKLSMSLILSHPNEYEGGEFEFDFTNKELGEKVVQCNEIKEKGSIVVFPSFIWHRVKPVKKGMRKSLVLWTLGDPFK